jgi:trimeric autotransporter adhesin
MKRLLTHLSVLLVSALALPAWGQQIITTFAGGGPADGTSATSAALGCTPCFLAVNSGGVYVSGGERVFKVNSAGNIFTVAGNALAGFSGDGGPATSATFLIPQGVALDSKGNLYIADQWNNRVRKVDTSGIITTVAGNGTQGFGGDGAPAVGAELNRPTGLAVDNAGNLYISDTGNARVRKVDSSGTISTVAGNGIEGFSGDGVPAINAELNFPGSLATKGGNLYIADSANDRIRRVDSSGKISTVAGNGTQGFGGDGGPATSAELAQPWGVAVHGANLYIADTLNHRVRKVDSSGKISTVAGDGTAGFDGDGGPATSAILNWPYSVGVDSGGNLYIADWAEERVRKVNTSGTISTFAGNGTAGFSGDGGPANSAQLSTAGVASDGNGSFYIADTGNQRIRKVDATGMVSTVAGNGTEGFGGDGGPATNAEFRSPYAVAVDSHGNTYIADTFNQRIRKVDSSGMISTVAGRGGPGFGGDGGPATQAKLHNPIGVAVDASGSLYIADQNNNRVRKVDTSGIISTFARTKGVSCVAVDDAGNVYMCDPSHHRLLKQDTSGALSTIAGNGKLGFSGDGGPATRAELSSAAGVAVDGAGNIYISDSTPVYLGLQPANDRVRRVDPSGIISTVAGTGAVGFTGDGGPAPDAELAFPNGLAVDSSGNLYITDAASGRIRKVTAPPHANSDGRK